MQNKKIQMWALSMSGYNCNTKNIEGTTNTCADLLSRHSDKVNETQNSDKELDGDQTVLDVNDNLFEINMLDSNQFDSKWLASCNLPDEESFEKCDCSDFRKLGFDMKVEQIKPDGLLEIRSRILNGKDPQKHYLLVDDLVYLISDVDDDPCLRLFIPKHIISFVVTQYHDQNGHMDVQKTFDSIRAKYYRLNLLKKLHKVKR